MITISRQCSSALSSTNKKGEGEVLLNDATIFENIGNSPKSK